MRKHVSINITARANKQPRKHCKPRATVRIIYYRGLTLLARATAHVCDKLAGDS